MRPDDGLDQTMAIARNADGSADPAQTVREAGASRPQYALRAVTGPRKGELTALDHANTMIGTAGGDTALVVRRGRGYFLARLAGRGRIRLNAGELGPGTHAIGENDRIEVGGSTFELIRIGDEKPPGTQT
jgi:hypothetical protein